jgi:hypothetical protein
MPLTLRLELVSTRLCHGEVDPGAMALCEQGAVHGAHRTDGKERHQRYGVRWSSSGEERLSVLAHSSLAS